jgi:hypothetical protein
MAMTRLVFTLLFSPALSAVLYAQTFQSANRKVTSIGAVTVNIPLPDSFKNILDNEGQLKALALAGKAPGNELVGVFADAESIENATKHRLSLPFSIRVAYYAKMRDQPFTESELTSFRISRETKSNVVLKLGTEEFKAWLRQINEKLAKNIKINASYAIQDFTDFGIIDSAPDHFTVMMLINHTDKNEVTAKLSATLVTTTFATVKGRLIFLYTHKLFETADDIVTIKKFCEDWFIQIRAANP